MLPTKKFRELTSAATICGRGAIFIGAREAFAERDRLSEALHPGSSEPIANNSGHRVGD